MEEHDRRREDISARSCRENRGCGERERIVRIQGESFSLVFAFLMGLVLLVWKRARGLPGEDMPEMFRTASAASRIYRLVQRRSTSDVVMLAICLAFLGDHLVQFFQIAG